MDPERDLRRLYSMDEFVDIGWHLMFCQPPETNEKDVGQCTAGLDCLVTVVRRIYIDLHSNVDTQKTDLFVDAEKENPLLAYAWQAMDGEDPIQAVIKTKKAILAKFQAGDPECDLSFEALCASDLMMRTFWANKELVLIKDNAHWLKSSQEWQFQHKSLMDLARISALSLDLTKEKGLTLQKLVDKQCGISDDGTTLNLPNMPLAVRISIPPFDPLHNVSDVTSFDDVRSIFIPELEWIAGDNGANIYMESGRQRYMLAAVVRLRELSDEDEDSPDQVRVYSPGGQPIRSASMTVRRWKIPFRTYADFGVMLLYCHAGNRVPDPLGSELPLDQRELRSIADDIGYFLERKSRQRALTTESERHPPPEK